MIQYLKVKGLNNRFDDEFEFNEDLNIFTGANGSGKTTLLKLIWYLISGNLERILPEIPFDFVSIVTDSFSLTITHLDSGKVKFVSEKNTFSRSVDFTVTLNPEIGDLGGPEYSEELHKLNVDIAKAMKSSLFFPTFRRIEGGFSSMSEYTDIDSIEYQFSQIAQKYPYRIKEMPQIHKAISEFSTRISVHDYGHKLVASISTHDIVSLVGQKHSEISTEENKNRRNSSDEILQKIRDNSNKRNRTETNELKEAKLLLDETQKKLEEVDRQREALFQPISVLSEYVNNFFKNYGIRITENVTLGHDTEVISNTISSDKLSAGEKQMLSFLCYNAFSDKTIIFIDEPELSLNVDWQRLLLPTLLKQGASNQFFIATHSPFIYAKYPDKEFLLGYDRGGDI